MKDVRALSMAAALLCAPARAQPRPCLAGAWLGGGQERVQQRAVDGSDS